MLLNKYPSNLRYLVDKHFNLEDLQVLCFDLEVDYEHLPGDTKPIKIISLILYLQRENRLPDLLEYCRNARPRVHWPEWPPSSQGESEQEQPLETNNKTTNDDLSIPDWLSELYTIVITFRNELTFHTEAITVFDAIRKEISQLTLLITSQLQVTPHHLMKLALEEKARIVLQNCEDVRQALVLALFQFNRDPFKYSGHYPSNLLENLEKSLKTLSLSVEESNLF